MNTTANALFFAVITVASAAAIGLGLADATSAPTTQQIVKLERVVVEGKRAAAPQVIAQLPRVVIHGRSTVSTASADTVVASACAAQTLC